MNISTQKWQLLLKHPKSVTLHRRFRPTNIIPFCERLPPGCFPAGASCDKPSATFHSYRHQDIELPTSACAVTHDRTSAGRRLDRSRKRERIKSSAKESRIILEKRDFSPCIPGQATDFLVPKHYFQRTCYHDFLCLIR